MTPERSPRSPVESKSGHWILWTFLFAAGSLVTLVGLVAIALVRQFDQSLPAISSIQDYHPALVSTMYAADGSLLAELYTERRYLIHLEQLPPHLIHAFLAAEDARFYEHQGLDLAGIFRALMKNLEAGEIVQGGSTITQQVVKSLLLTPERTWMRKLKEAVLAYRLDNSLSKDEILTLYLNQIYLGSGGYGVEGAARTYFGQHADQLNLAEAALLAGLPKAPSRFSPYNNMQVALERQHYVLERMVETGFISPEQAKAARAEPLNILPQRSRSMDSLNSFTEEARRRLEERFGKKTLYEEGLRIRTTLEPAAQQLAQAAVLAGLRELDQRHGYRGPEASVEPARRQAFTADLAATNPALEPSNTLKCLVSGYDGPLHAFRLQCGTGEALLDLKNSAWPASTLNSLAKTLKPGDVVRVRIKTDPGAGHLPQALLVQQPEAEGAFLALEPASGRVLCMVGGKDFGSSQFNRAVQALRQPGSSFKPIIYTAALDNGFTPAAILIDSPIIKEDRSLQGAWKPSNYDHKFLGPILLRYALIHSRNVVTIKLLDAVGIETVINFARHLGIQSPLTPTLSLALGASEVSLWELLTAYTAFANQGIRTEPYLIESVRDRDGNLLEQYQPKQEQVISAQTAFLITDILQGVIREGTGRRVSSLGRPAAGKTGTTNDLRDAWFIGYTPEVLAGAWVGYDDHRKSLGSRETGGRAASPVWLYFMSRWLEGKPVRDFPVPPEIVFAKVNPRTGRLAAAGEEDAVYMAFAKGALPAKAAPSEPGPAAEGQGNAFFKSDLF